MSIVQLLESNVLTPEAITKGQYEPSNYQPDEATKTVRSLVLKHFMLGYVTMYKPRVEFSDLSVIARMQVDQMSFNTYQPNNGDALDSDTINSWKSRAMRPIVRNKCISIAAHATARLIFPKIFAWNDNSDSEQDAAQVMMDLMEWAADQSNYAYYSLNRTMTALTDPASIGYTEYAEAYRKVKTEKVDGKWKEEVMKDEELSGFQDCVVPVDELFIENFYEPDIQKQGFLIWRRVISYSLAQAKYAALYPNFNEYVRPGVQILYNDANQSFYQVYDTNMRQEDVEEVIYWNKALDLKIILVNGVMMTDPDNPNPRIDKLYPFDKFGYEPINNRCFYYKSLAFKMQHDANIINTLYPMIIDGTYLNLMPPMIVTGAEAIGSEVIVPGAVTTLSSPDANLRPVATSNNLKAGQDALFQVEESINQSSQEPIQSGQPQAGNQTAYEISRLEQNANTVLGLFIQMISKHVKDFGKLRVGDILQHLTIPDVDKITDQSELVYKTFLLQEKASNGRAKSRKIMFDSEMPTEPISAKDRMMMSYDILEQEDNSKQEIYKVNPMLVRDLKYMCAVSPDVLNPMSEDLERAYMLEEYDRAIQNPLLDQEQVTRDFLIGAYPKSRKDPDKYFKKGENPMMANPMTAMAQPNQGSLPRPRQAQNPQLAATPGVGQAR